MKPKRLGIKAAILAMSVVQMGTNAISPILADIALTFPEAESFTIQFLMTFPSLLVLVFSLLAAIAAKQIPKRILAALGCALFALSGILSFLFHTALVLLFAWAALAGIGIGLVVPMATSLISDLFSAGECQKMMGLQSTAANAGAMTMTLLGGMLAGIHWKYNYLVYIIAIPGLFLSLLFLPKGRVVPSIQNDDRSILPLMKQPAILRSCVLALLVTMLFNTAPTNLSMLLEEKTLGTAAQAGTATTILLFSGSLGGLLFGKLAQKFGRYVIVLGFSMLAVGQLLCAIAGNLAAIMIGCLICGCAISLVMPQAMLEASAQARENTAGSSALVMASSNLGGFCAPVLTMIVSLATGGDSTTPRFIASAFCGGAIAIITTILIRANSSTKSSDYN